ncbi:MAG TPA: hypothetical protein VHE13_06955 [Opitutus sp.]|jgi:hypothetical protein|nr:hypothetical protein [Opitutus sp.]
MSTPPPVLTTKRRIKRFAPLQLGLMLALLYGIMGLIVTPVFLLISWLPHQAPRPEFALGAGVLLVVMPVVYAVLGFLFGLIGAMVYNGVARFAGGIEVEVA